MKVLIFGTIYCDTEEKRTLAEQWCTLHTKLNPSSDLMLVDSASPLQPIVGSVRLDNTGNNIGHLSCGGQDGWGRAFSYGLQAAIDDGYDYVVHMEGDSLCRLPMWALCEEMAHDEVFVASMPVVGTKRAENKWIETGLMAFDVEYVDESNMIDDYNWQDGKAKAYPNTPERVLWKLNEHHLHLWPFRGMRDDRGILTPRNADDYHWISHTTPEVYAAFYDYAMENA